MTHPGGEIVPRPVGGEVVMEGMAGRWAVSVGAGDGYVPEESSGGDFFPRALARSLAMCWR
jgi:hypothetical protein